MKHPLALVALASCVTAAANAASPPVPENLQACSKLPDAGERVRCYDAEIAKMNASAGSGAGGTRAAPTAAAGTSAGTPTAAAGGTSAGAPTAAAGGTSAGAPTAAAASTAPAPTPALAASTTSATPTPPATSTAPPAASTAAAAAPPPAAAANNAQTAPSAMAKFGEETLPATARPKARPEDEAALLSSITELHAVASQKFTISLANGQVWRQEQPSQLSLFFRVGDRVRIEKGALGSYHMSTDTTGAKNWVRVTRIQ